MRKHPVLVFYALVFGISWGGILALVAPTGIPGTSEQVERLMFVVLLAMFAGPSLSGILVTGLAFGREGLRELLSRLFRWRVDFRWYAIALLLGPLLVATVLLGLSLASTVFLPGILARHDRLGWVLFSVAWGLVGGGLLEELGWTGLAIPVLRLRRGAFATGLVVGLLWGAWHFLVAFWTSSAFSGGSLATYTLGVLAFYLGSLPAFRVLMVWVYDRTGSLPVAMLMHASLSAGTLIFQPLATGMPYLIWNLALAVAAWITVAAAAAAPGVVLPESRGPFPNPKA